MNYWWVNHSGTHTQEVAGGYIWCPPTDVNGHPRETYTNLTRAAVGDIVFSYAHKAIRAIGVVKAKYSDAPKPDYGSAGSNWSATGWLLPIEWTRLGEPLQPLAIWEQIQPLMPAVHAPLTSAGTGAMNVYLAKLDEELGALLQAFIARDNDDVPQAVADAAAEQAIAHSAIPETTKLQLINARLGQGLFRSRVSAISPRCRVTGTADPRVLIASHIKPWCESSNEERLDGHNGLLLAPHVDKLFDRFWISFQDDGQLITAGPAAVGLLRNWGIDPDLPTEPLTRQQRKYMAYHRGRSAEVSAEGLWVRGNN